MLDPFPKKSRPIQTKFRTEFDGFHSELQVRFGHCLGSTPMSATPK
jgi:hypothetical protein